ncbi:MAG: M23 family metallopeptidase [Christensenella sp.]|nr:M23 family metallopeptidase [Christensenella sp.]
MKRLFKRRMTIVLLSVLLAASTASIRSSLAAAETPAPAPEASGAPTGAEAVLRQCCEGASGAGTNTAAYAAELLRFDEGYISSTSQTKQTTKSQRLYAAFSAAERLMRGSMTQDWASWNATLVEFDPTVYDSYAQNVGAFSALADSFNEEIQTASATAVREISRNMREEGIALKAPDPFSTRLNWRECAALYYVFAEDMLEKLADSFPLDWEGNVRSGVSLRLHNPSFEEIAKKGTHDQLVEAIFALDYLNTVYNDDGTTAPIEHHVFSKEYLATVAHPVPGGLIKNGWYDPRSRKTRLHMGTDIKRRAKTPILAATDGVVKYIGFLPIPGYYVIIEDPFGFVYHYYHMFELTTFVKEGDTVRQGQQIGIVGSTGNSVAYHLHLSLVSPEGKYINPYDLFVQAGIGPVLKD